MADIAFHFGAPDRLAYTCRLLRKAVASGARLLVCANGKTAEALDNALWNLSPSDFLPHCDAAAPRGVQQRSAILIQAQTKGLHEDRPVLVNLGDEVPPGFELYQRVIEIVSTDEGERNLARRRWKHYTDLGYAITRHDLKNRSLD